MAAAGQVGIGGQASPNISVTFSQTNSHEIPFNIRQNAIDIAVALINIETMSDLTKRLVTQLASPEQETCFLSTQILSILQWKLKQNQAQLKQMSGKSELEWITEDLAIKDGVADLQKTSPDMFLASRIPADERSLSLKQLQAFHNEFLVGIHESFS